MIRTGVFVDVANQFPAVFREHGGKLHYSRYLREAGPSTCAFAYGAQILAEAEGFIADLRRYGFTPRYREARLVDGRPSIKDTSCNVLLTLDVVRHIDRLDHMVIGSNDPDLVPLVEFVRAFDKRVTVFAAGVGPELRSAAPVVDIPAALVMRKFLCVKS